MILTLRVTPNAGRDAFVSRMDDGSLKIKLRAPAVDGKANAGLIDFLAKTFGVSKSAVTILTGETSRQKRVEIAGIESDGALTGENSA